MNVLVESILVDLKKPSNARLLIILILKIHFHNIIFI